MIKSLIVRGCAGTLLLGSQVLFGQSLTATNGLKLWLKADAGVTTNATGGVTEWVDQSGNSNNALQPDDTATPKLLPAP